MEKHRNITISRVLTPGAILGALGVWAGYRLLTSPHFSFTGKVVLITGGTRGLGLTLARLLVEQAARVAICARNKEELTRAVNDLRGIRPDADVFGTACDVTVREQAEQMVHQIVQRFGRIDVLINNAGVIMVGPFSTMEVEDYDLLMKVHFWAPLYLSLAALPYMQRQQEGRIANISSIGGRVSIPHLAAYTASKFALTGLSEAMRQDLRREGILVTTVCPGLMRTGSHGNAVMKGDQQAEYQLFRLAAAYPPLSMNVERAARRILKAIQEGRPEITVGLPAKILDKWHGIAPNSTSRIMELISTFLPPPSRGAGVPGRAIPLSPWLRWATAHLDRASAEHNQPQASG